MNIRHEQTKQTQDFARLPSRSEVNKCGERNEEKHRQW